jgi:hypothetical protein
MSDQNALSSAKHRSLHYLLFVQQDTTGLHSVSIHQITNPYAVFANFARSVRFSTCLDLLTATLNKL